MKTHLLTLHILLTVVLLAQLSSGEVREKAHQRSCSSGSREESCGTEETKTRYKKESQKKYMNDDDDDDEDDDESSDEEDDNNGDDDTEIDELPVADGDGVDTGGSTKKREAQEKRTKDSTRADGRSSEGKKNREAKGKHQKAPKDATNTGHDKSASKENKNRNDKDRHMKGDKAKTTGDSATKKGERNEGIGKKGYDPKKPSMKSGETSRTERDVGNKGKSREQPDIGKPEKKGGKYAGNDEGSPETVAEADENVDGSTDDASLRKEGAGKRKYACNLRKGSKLSGASETDIEGNPVECTGEADETTATGDALKEIQDEVVNADESRNSIPEASDATETTDKRDQDTNNDIHGAVSDSSDYVSSEISSSEPTTATPGSYEPPPFPQVTPEFDSSTVLPEHLRTGKSDVNEDATDTENWESHLSGGRKVEVDVTDEQNEEVIHDSDMDNLEDSQKSVQYNDNSAEAGDTLQEADDSENEETEPELLVQENPDTLDTDDALGLDHEKK